MFCDDKMASKYLLTCFVVNLTFGPFDPKIWSVHLCPQVHQTCKFGEIPTVVLEDTVFTNFWDSITNGRMGSPKMSRQLHRSNGDEGIKMAFQINLI